MIDVREFAIEHKFDSAYISWNKSGRWNVTVHGNQVGEFGCCFGHGDTPEEAATALLKNVQTYRSDVEAIAAGEEAAKAARIAKIKAELESLTGEPA